MSNPTAVQTWQCRQCGKQCERPRKPGSSPKYCSRTCQKTVLALHYLEAKVCPWCDNTFVANVRVKYCSRSCAVRSRQHPLVTALNREDWQGVIDEARNQSRVDKNGCWIWTMGLSRQGYPELTRAGTGVHRCVVQAKTGGVPLGSQHVHHACAVRACVNPDHLMLVTASENILEMRARNAYLRRIEELESALREVAPEHPALSVAPYL